MTCAVTIGTRANRSIAGFARGALLRRKSRDNLAARRRLSATEPAHRLHWGIFGILSQAFPLQNAFALCPYETDVRSAIVLGIIGACSANRMFRLPAFRCNFILIRFRS